MPHLNLLVLRSSQPELLAEFYSVLGLQFTQHRHGNGPLHFAAEDEHGFVFEIYPLRKAEGSTQSREIRIGFVVPNVHQAVSDLIAKDNRAQVTTAPADSPWGLRAVIIDPDGHSVELTQPSL